MKFLSSSKKHIHSKKAPPEDSKELLDFADKTEGFIVINNRIPSETYAFKMRVSNLSAYNATYVSGKIVLPKNETYIPKGHFSKKQYKKAMELVLKQSH